MLQNPRRWNMQLVQALFSKETTDLILKMHLVQYGCDRLIWEPSKTGEFTVESTYKALTNSSNNTDHRNHRVTSVIWKRLWKKKAPHKVKLFIWKCLRKIVPTRVKINNYRKDIETICPRCLSYGEIYNICL